MWEEKGKTTVPDNTKRHSAALRFAFRRVSHWRSSLPFSLPVVCFSVIVGQGRPTWKRITDAWFHHHWTKNMSAILTEWGVTSAYQDFNDIFLLIQIPRNFSLSIIRLISNNSRSVIKKKCITILYNILSLSLSLSVSLSLSLSVCLSLNSYFLINHRTLK